MPQFIPNKDIKKTSDLSEICHNQKIYKDLEISEQQITEGRTLDARNSLNSMREKYGL